MNGSDPFASTSKALGRAAERRGQRRRDENGSGARSSKSGMTATASFDSSSQQPSVPSRNYKGDTLGVSSSHNKSRSRGSGSRSSREYQSSSSRDQQLHHSAARGEKSILDVLPPEYRYNPKNAAPVLYHLQKTLEPKNGESNA